MFHYQLILSFGALSQKFHCLRKFIITKKVYYDNDYYYNKDHFDKDNERQEFEIVYLFISASYHKIIESIMILKT